MCNNTCDFGVQKNPDHCNVLYDSKIYYQDFFESRTDVNKIFSLLIFLMLSRYNVLSDYIFSHQL